MNRHSEGETSLWRDSWVNEPQWVEKRTSNIDGKIVVFVGMLRISEALGLVVAMTTSIKSTVGAAQ